jgi:hypothetical protein
MLTLVTIVMVILYEHVYVIIQELVITRTLREMRESTVRSRNNNTLKDSLNSRPSLEHPPT